MDPNTLNNPNTEPTSPIKKIFQSKKNLPIILSIILVILVIIFTWIYLSSAKLAPSSNEVSGSKSSAKKASQDQLSPSPLPSPTLLTPGPGIYNISQGDHNGPTIRQVIFDPLDVKKGELLTITLKVLSSTPAQTISGTLKTDESIENLSFDKISSATDYETWVAKLTLPQTVLYKYILTLSPSSDQGSSKVVVAPRS